MLPLVAAAQEFSNAWLALHPSVNSVLDNIEGNDDLETATKQSAALTILSESVRSSAPNEFSLSGEHAELFQIYRTAFSSVKERVKSAYGDDSPEMREFARGVENLRHDRDFYLEVYEAVWPELAGSYRARLEAAQEQESQERLYGFAALAAGIIFLLFAFNYLRKDFSRSTMSPDGQLVIRRNKYQLHKVTGAVVGANKHTETVVSGGGGGTSAPVRIESETFVHDNLVLEDADAKKHSVEVMDFNLNTMDGNILTIAWAIRKGKQRGPYIYIYDHDTRQAYAGTNRFGLGKIHQMHTPSFIWDPIVTAALVLLWLVIMEVLPLSAWLVVGVLVFGWIFSIQMRRKIGKAKARRLMQSDEFQAYIREDMEQPGGFSAQPS